MKTRSTTNTFIAKKSLGQNFLINQGILAKIIAAGQVTSKDKVIEVGPGKGGLTEHLLKAGAHVIAVEKDNRLIEALQTKFDGENFSLLEKDILEVDPTEMGLEEGDYKIVANIPYYITSHFLRIIFEKWPRPKMVVVLVQKEVAQRIMSQPGDMSILALSVRFYGDPEVISYVSKGSFSPPPKVDSAILKITPKKNIDKKIEKRFFELIKAGFAGKRKKLISNLKNIGAIDPEQLERIFAHHDLDINIRAEDLSLNQWLELAREISF